MSEFIDEGLDPVARDRPTITCVICFDEGYVPHAAVTLASLSAFARQSSFYEIVVLENQVERSSRRLLEEFIDAANVQLRWFSMGDAFQDRDAAGRWNRTALFRLAIPEVLPHHARAVYLDSDLVLLADVAELFNLEMGDAPIGAAYNGSAYLRLDRRGGIPGYEHLTIEEYYRDIVELSASEINRTFNSGVMLMNLDRMRAREDVSAFKADLDKPYAYFDQDILNRRYRGDAHFMIPQEWNVENLTDPERKVRAPEIYEHYRRARANPRVIHFTDKPWVAKPWRYDPPLAEHYWRLQERSPWGKTVRSRYERERRLLGVRPPPRLQGLRALARRVPGLQALWARLRNRRAR